MSPLQTETKRILMEQMKLPEPTANGLAMGNRDTWLGSTQVRRWADIAERQALANLERNKACRKSE